MGDFWSWDFPLDQGDEPGSGLFMTLSPLFLALLSIIMGLVEEEQARKTRVEDMQCWLARGLIHLFTGMIALGSGVMGTIGGSFSITGGVLLLVAYPLKMFVPAVAKLLGEAAPVQGAE
jgi:hypothetical protein